MRDIRHGICPVCEHHEILEAIPAEFADQNQEKVSAVTYEPRWILSGRNPNQPHGALRLYVCRGCGFTQTYADNPSAIPVGPQYWTRVIVGAQRSEPFR